MLLVFFFHQKPKEMRFTNTIKNKHTDKKILQELKQILVGLFQLKRKKYGENNYLCR
jgi:hypothetical protein